jgi:glycosyltransferase involved in cell wall biosynthesis
MPENAKNVLFVSMSDTANGAEKVLLMSANVLTAPIIFLTRVSHGGLNLGEDQPVKYAADKSMVIGFIKLVKLLAPYRTGFIIISTHAYLNAYLGFLKRLGFIRSKLIVRESTSVFTRFSGLKKWSYQLAYYLGYPAVDLVVCQTDLMKRQFAENMPFIDKRIITVQENPVDLAQLITRAGKNINDDEANGDFICAAGRLIPEKGFSILINAFNRVAGQYPNLKLLIFGDGPEKQTIEDLIENLKLQGRVVLKGWNENPLPYFKKARVCVVSSVKEGFPNVLLEMMAVNPAVVSTLCAGGIETIPGIEKVEVNHIDALAGAIDKALEKNGAAAKQTVEKYLRKRSPELFIGSLLNALG